MAEVSFMAHQPHASPPPFSCPAHSPRSMQLALLSLVLGLSLPVALLALPAQECPAEFGTSGWVNDLGLLADTVSMGGADFKDDSKGVCGTFKVLKTCEARVRKEAWEGGGGMESEEQARWGFPYLLSSSSSSSSIPPFLPLPYTHQYQTRMRIYQSKTDADVVVVSFRPTQQNPEVRGQKEGREDEGRARGEAREGGRTRIKRLACASLFYFIKPHHTPLPPSLPSSLPS